MWKEERRLLLSEHQELCIYAVKQRADWTEERDLWSEVIWSGDESNSDSGGCSGLQRSVFLSLRREHHETGHHNSSSVSGQDFRFTLWEIIHLLFNSDLSLNIT